MDSFKNDNDSLTVQEMDSLAYDLSKFKNDLSNVLIEIFSSIRDNMENNKIEDVKENGVDEAPKLKKGKGK